MKVISAPWDQVHVDGPCVLTIGNFDGLHRGHQRLLERAGELARSAGLPLVVMTFEPHPLAIIVPEHTPPRLMLLGEKLGLLESSGADIAIVVRSCTALFGLHPQEFMSQIIERRCRAVHVVEGDDFNFGAGREGDVNTLRKYGESCGFAVHVVPPVLQALPDGHAERVSSSLIRRLLGAGQAELAAAALGRPYRLRGPVVRGVGRGRKLGFPTANIEISAQMVPAEGVYAGQVQVDERTLAAAVSIGRTPTFAGQERKVEAHLLDFEGDLYGLELGVDLLRWLRPQREFASAEALVGQLRVDVREIRSTGAAGVWSAGPQVSGERS